jgi:uncharacterized protein (DUF736 family)
LQLIVTSEYDGRYSGSIKSRFSMSRDVLIIPNLSETTSLFCAPRHRSRHRVRLQGSKVKNIVGKEYVSHALAAPEFRPADALSIFAALSGSKTHSLP